VQGFRRGLNVVIFGPLLLLALVTGLNLLQIARLIHAIRAVDSADLTLSSAREVQELAVDMETATRGFELTGEAAFLEPYRNAQVAMPGALAELDRLADPDETSQVAAIRSAVAEWKHQADAALADGQDGIRLEGELHAKKQMDRVRERVDALVRGELAERAEFGPGLEHQMRFGLAAALAVALTLGLMMGLVSQRQFSNLCRHYEVALDESEAREAAQRRVNEALAASEANFRALVEALPDAVVVHRRGQVVFANAAALEKLGRSAEELEGTPISTLLVARERELVRARVELLETQGGANPPSEQHILRKDATVMRAEVTGTTVSYQGAPAVMARIHDLTDRDIMTTRLTQMDRMVAIGTLAAGVAHEINNPLAFVMSSLSFALSELGGEAPAMGELASALAEAKEGAVRIRDIVRDLKGFSRVDDEVGEVEVNRAIQAALNLGSAELRRCARVSCDLQPVPTVRGNERKLGQVILNLLINAAQACASGAARDHEVRVRSRCVGDRVEIAVEDTGSGIPAEVLPHIFEPFFTTKPVGQGTGLGLPICQNIVAGMGGELRVHTSPGEGTVFTVALPVACEAALQDAA